jgi:hypothetical protein
MNATHPRRSHDHGCGPFSIEEPANRPLIGKIELLVRAQQQVVIAPSPERPNHGRPYQTSMPGDINSRIWIELHFSPTRGGYRPCSLP